MSIIKFRDPPPPTPAEVYAERDRRLQLPATYDFGDARGVHLFGLTEDDQRGWDKATTCAQTRITLGSDKPLTISTKTGVTTVTPREWLAVIDALSTHQQTIWAASFVLEESVPIPFDYKSDIWWQEVM